MDKDGELRAGASRCEVCGDRATQVTAAGIAVCDEHGSLTKSAAEQTLAAVNLIPSRFERNPKCRQNRP